MNYGDVPPVVTSKRNTPYVLIAVFVVVAMLAASTGALATYYVIGGLTDQTAAVKPDNDEEATEFQQQFLDVFNLVRAQFVDGIDDETLWAGAIAGLVRAVGDPYSSYLDMRELQDLLEQTSGSYVGIGVVLTQVNEYPVIVSPFPATPAEEVGLRPMDTVLAVDGRSVVGMPLEAVVSLIRGPEGTETVLTIGRGDEEFDVVVKRAVINIPTVVSEVRDDNIGYIRLTHFSWNTTEELKRQLDELMGQGIEGLILDLRGNPGGDLEICIQVAGLLVPEGPVVHLIDKEGERTTYSSSSDGVDVPIVVLVNGGTGSSSEILAGAIRDRGVGILLGTRTFGKASVQTIFPLDIGTAVRLTTARYLTPDGTMIDGVGLEPDIYVELGEDDEDVQLEEAIAYLTGRR